MHTRIFKYSPGGVKRVRANGKQRHMSFTKSRRRRQEFYETMRAVDIFFIKKRCGQIRDKFVPVGHILPFFIIVASLYVALSDTVPSRIQQCYGLGFMLNINFQKGCEILEWIPFKMFIHLRRALGQKNIKRKHGERRREVVYISMLSCMVGQPQSILQVIKELWRYFEEVNLHLRQHQQFSQSSFLK